MTNFADAPSLGPVLRQVLNSKGDAAANLQVRSRGLCARPDWFHVYTPRQVEWNQFDLPLANLPTGLIGTRIVHLSDVHLRTRWLPALDPIIERLRRDPPDLLLFTGDFVNNKFNYRPAMPLVRRWVDGLTARFGCFAIHGNHDHYEIGAELGNSPLQFLDGSQGARQRVVHVRGGAIEVLGLPGWRRLELTPALVASYAAKRVGVPRLILSHFPDHLLRIGALQGDVVFAGHTHGGQICLPGRIPVVRHDTLPRRLTTGVHRVDGAWLVVSRGIGFTGLPIRAFCPPEVAEFRLIRQGE